MIHQLILENFESHEKTILDFGKGFNAITGDNNIGKTSVVRAINLVAYNIFDPESVRIGSKNCSVTMITDRGKVKVVRGTLNEWYITPNGEPTKFFEKIGKNILNEVIEITGFKKVELGGLEIPVNVMNQLEGHFMMAELNGKNSSGSVRAQIIDEVSGLSGIEDVIKAVGLDRTRVGKEVKLKEGNIRKEEDILDSDEEIEKQQDIIDKAEELLEEAQKIQEDSLNAAELCDMNKSTINNIEFAKDSLNKFPNTNKVKINIDGLEDCINKHKSLKELEYDYYNSNDISGHIVLSLGGYPDVSKIDTDALSEYSEYISIMKDMNSEYSDIESKVEKANEFIKESSISVEPPSIEDYEKIEKLKKINDEYNELKKSIVVVENNFKEIDTSFEELKEEEVELINGIKICPLTLKEAHCKIGS